MKPKTNASEPEELEPFEQHYMTRDQVDEAYNTVLRNTELELFQARLNRRVGAQGGEEVLRRTLTKLRRLSADYEAWLAVNPEEEAKQVEHPRPLDDEESVPEAAMGDENGHDPPPGFYNEDPAPTEVNMRPA